MSSADTDPRSEPGTTALFIDTGPLYARFVETANRHDRATTVFETIGEGAVPYRPLFTATYVLDELATLILSHRDHDAAVRALERVQGAPVTLTSSPR